MLQSFNNTLIQQNTRDLRPGQPGLWPCKSFSIVNPSLSLDNRALCRQLQVVLHHHRQQSMESKLLNQVLFNLQSTHCEVAPFFSNSGGIWRVLFPILLSMVAKISPPGLIQSSSAYLRSARGRFPLPWRDTKPSGVFQIIPELIQVGEEVYSLTKNELYPLVNLEFV